jgi:hypothetical protein
MSLPTRQFSPLELTSGPPGDTREADGCATERHHLVLALLGWAGLRRYGLRTLHAADVNVSMV